MTIHTGSRTLLAKIPDVLSGVALQVLDADGAEAQNFGVAGEAVRELRVDLPGGAIVAAVPAAAAGVGELIGALLAAVADREQLESDIESMSNSALRLLEQVAMMGETLPRLSAVGDDAEIAALGVRACHRAAGVERVAYLQYDHAKECCEVVVLYDGDARRRPDREGEVDLVHPVTGLLADVLAAEGVVLRTVPAGSRLGEPGSIEHLAQGEVLGVPVTYGAGDKRVTLGALLLLDRASGFGKQGGQGGDPLGNEEGQVAESFAAMLGAVLGARKVASLGKELSMAKEIQRQILPAQPVVMAGFDVAAHYFACGAVGGDYYDYVPLADGRTMVVIADVSGHNLASGMVMVGARSMLRALAIAHSEPHLVFSALAQHLFEDLTRTERFLTAAAVALRPNGRAIDYVSAGHNDLIVYRAATDRIERLPSDGTILGFLEKPEYNTRRVLLEPGDVMLLYTDGIPEALDAQGEMFGEDRLGAVFAQLAPNRSARRILDGLVHELDTFRRGQVGTDDVTAVVIRCLPEGDRR